LGFRDLERRIQATPDTVYQVASLTKTLTSTILMTCVEAGRLTPDGLISKYTSSYAGTRITVRLLFTHTADSVPPGVDAGNNERQAGGAVQPGLVFPMGLW